MDTHLGENKGEKLTSIPEVKEEITSITHEITSIPEVKEEYEINLDDYEFAHKLGQGAFGIVKLCHKKSDPSKKYAMKTITTEKTDHINRVQREINILIELNYDSACKDFILCYLGSTVKDSIYYILTDYAEGYENLDIVFQKIDEPAILGKIYENMCKAVKYIHSKGIAHLDIKLSNILVKDTDIKIIDFGGACNSTTNDTNDDFKLKVSCDEKPAITLIYADPVYLIKNNDGMQYHMGTDLWSLGLCLYELAFKKLPNVFIFNNLNEQLNYKLNDLNSSNTLLLLVLIYNTYLIPMIQDTYTDDIGKTPILGNYSLDLKVLSNVNNNVKQLDTFVSRYCKECYITFREALDPDISKRVIHTAHTMNGGRLKKSRRNRRRRTRKTHKRRTHRRRRVLVRNK
jgi:serine/threonine protein kinase